MNLLFDPSLYAQRRARLASIIHQGLVILPNALPKTRSFDSEYPFRWDSSFYYLCGFWEANSTLAIRIADGRCLETILFCHPKDPYKELWEGKVTGIEAAISLVGVDVAYDFGQCTQILKERYLSEGGNIWFSLGEHPELDHFLISHCKQSRKKIRSGARIPTAICDVKPLIDDMRLHKEKQEIEVMREAAAISVEGHFNAMKRIRPGTHEYTIEAELIHTFRQHNTCHAYNPIVAAGENACTLHYNNNDAPLKEGELLLIDAACERYGYACDITRTYPISGRYTPVQARLYDAVLDAQEQAIRSLAVGKPIACFHETAIQVLSEHLIKLGLLTGTPEEVIRSRAYEAFYMHGTGHWIGLDVHDPGPYPTGQASELYEAGMLITVEPGLYIPPSPTVPQEYWNIGIRIEDVVLITDSTTEVLTQALPKKRADIEAFMDQHRYA